MILIKNYERAIYLYFHRTCQPQCSISDHSSSAAMVMLCSFWRTNAFFPPIIIAPGVWGNEDRSIHFIYQCECKSWGADSPIGQKSSCEEYAPHTAKCILGGIFFTISHLLVHSTVFWQCGFGLGHPNQMFHFPLPSTQKVGSVSRIKKKSKNNFKVIQFL